MKKNGFTLIELLAVIIILGVIMLIAIPSVTSAINESRKETYIKTAQTYVKEATIFVNQGLLNMFDLDATYYIPSSCISVESGGASPFGEFDPAYIVVTFTGDSYNYYWISRDTSEQGIANITPSYNLNPKLITTGIKKDKVTPNTVIGKRTKIYVLADSNCEAFETEPIKKRVKDDGTPYGTPNEMYDGYMDEHNSELSGIDHYGNANVVEFLQSAIDSGFAGSVEERREQDENTLKAIGNYIKENMTYSELNSYANSANYYSSYKQIFQYGFDGGSGTGRLWFKDSWPGMYILISAGGYQYVPTTNASNKFYTNYPMFFGDDTFAVNKQYYVEIKVSHKDDKITSVSLRLGSSNNKIYTVTV